MTIGHGHAKLELVESGLKSETMRRPSELIDFGIVMGLIAWQVQLVFLMALQRNNV